MATSGQLRAFADRILRMKSEEDAIKADIREIYSEAVEADIDKTGLGQLVTYLRKRGKDATEFDAKEAVFLGYLAMYDASLLPSHAYAYARDEKFDADGVEIEQPETAKPVQSIASVNAPMTVATDANAGGENVAASEGYETRRDIDLVDETPRADVVGISSAVETGAPHHPYDAPTALSSEVVPFRAPKPLRPHCLNPQKCGGQGKKHCWSCESQMGETSTGGSAA